MKKCMKIALLGLFTILCIVPFISNAISITPQGDTTFNVDEGDSLIWTVTSGVPELRGSKYNLTIEDIYNGTHMTVDSYIINVTLRFYNKTDKTWNLMIDNDFFVAANETLDFIDYSFVVAFSPYYLIIPTPINLTMLGEYAVGGAFFNSYTINGEKITLTDVITIVYTITYNSDGILTKMVAKFEGITVSIMVLGSGGDGEAIPYGYLFIIFTLIGVISLVYLEKRKTK